MFKSISHLWAKAASAWMRLSASNSNIFSSKSMAKGFAPLKTSLKFFFFRVGSELM